MNTGHVTEASWVTKARLCHGDPLAFCAKCGDVIPESAIELPTGADHMTDSDWCWCQPRIEYVLPDGQLIIHRRTADGPE